MNHRERRHLVGVWQPMETSLASTTALPTEGSHGSRLRFRSALWRCLAPSVVSLAVLTASADVCDDYVAAGRASLVDADYTSARASFESALAMCPDHEEANALLAATRFPAWLETPAGSNFLTRVGIPSSGRILTNWTATPMKDIGGVPLAPAGIGAQEISDLLRTNVLDEIQASLENLERITNTGFLLNLSSNETRMADVTVDYADLLMLRAMLHATEYGVYTLHSWNEDALLSVIREVAVDGPNTLETLFANHPELLSYRTTNDLELARQAFVNACDLYQEASVLIRVRDPLTVRLFNADKVQAQSEEDFRHTLDDLKAALINPVVFWDNTNYTIFLQPHFAGQTPPRAFMPQFRANRFGLRTLPDLSLGGTVVGFTADYADQLLSEILSSTPSAGPGVVSDGVFSTVVRAEPYWPYQLQASTDFVKWKTVAETNAWTDTFVLSDPDAWQFPRRFYRILNPWDALIPPPDNDWFYSAQWMDGTNLVASANTTSASKEMWEPDHDGNPGGKSVWWVWFTPTSGTVTVSTQGSSFDTLLAVYTGWDLLSLSFVASDDDSGGNRTSLLHFNAVAGTVYQIAVDGYDGDSGTVNLRLTMP